MGGIDLETIPETFKLGFKGVGILGGVWNTENPVESFVNLKLKYNTVIAIKS